MPAKPPAPLSPELLRRRYPADRIPFATSDQMDIRPEVVLGQERAKAALEFGLAIREPGFHVFVVGPPRTGKTHLVKSYLERLARELPPPPDWAYVHNFHTPEEPRALRLAPGGGRRLAREMERLVEQLRKRVPEVFESEEHSRRKEQLGAQIKARRGEVFAALDRASRAEGYLLRFEPNGIFLAPADADGQVLPESRIREMSEEERAELRRKSDRLQAKVGEGLRQVAGLEKEMEEALRRMEREMVLFAVGPLFEELREPHAGEPEVLAYLDQAREDVSKHFSRFQKREAPPFPLAMTGEADGFTEFKVNVLVDNAGAQGAPVVLEDHPTFPNLFGRVERQVRMGALLTDFTLLTAGALHRANGGFLVLPLLPLLRLGLPWDGLKRALMRGRVVIEDAMEQYGFISTRTLRPEPIPLDLKVVLVGDPELFGLLHAHDPQFPKLFKVRAEMAERMTAGEGEVGQFIRHLCGLARDSGWPPLDREAVARLLELGAELAGDQERLTLKLSEVGDLLAEAAFYARQAERTAVTAADVDQAAASRRERACLVEDRLREAATRGFIRVRTEGREVGQVNGLAVLSTGDHVFGHPSRISASLGLGRGGVVAIEREAELSGPFHTKGVLILAGFLRERFGQDGPLALTASLAFEQSYSLVDGDSASLAELLALLSRLSGVPLRQDLAVTGSVSQKGEVQAIGGVNQKIEGFYRLCAARGLSGRQGVAVPRANLLNLMLHPEVVAAAAAGGFAVYPLETVEEAVALFTGKPAGRPGKDGTYPKGSVFELARLELKRLRELARREAGGGGKSGRARGGKAAKRPPAA